MVEFRWSGTWSSIAVLIGGRGASLVEELIPADGYQLGAGPICRTVNNKK